MTGRRLLHQDSACLRLLEAVDHVPRTSLELSARTRRLCATPLSHTQASIYLARLDASGDVAVLPGRPRRYLLTVRGELRRRACASRLSGSLARTLLMLSRVPERAARLAEGTGLSRYAFYQAAQALEGLGLAVRTGEPRAYAYALSELGVEALEEARVVMAYAAAVGGEREELSRAGD